MYYIKKLNLRYLFRKLEGEIKRQRFKIKQKIAYFCLSQSCYAEHKMSTIFAVLSWDLEPLYNIQFGNRPIFTVK